MEFLSIDQLFIPDTKAIKVNETQFCLQKLTDLERKKRFTQISIAEHKCYNKSKYKIQRLLRGKND